jgi:hypothetical protein
MLLVNSYFGNPIFAVRGSVEDTSEHTGYMSCK